MVSAKLKPGDEARFAAALQKLVALSGEPVEDILRDQGRLFAVDASNFTKRFGDKKSHGEAHKRRIKTDIQRVYKPAKWAIGLIGKTWGSSAAKRFQKLLKAKNIGQMQDMVNKANLSRFYGGRRVNIIMWDGGAAHTRFEKRGLKGNNPVSLVVNFAGNVTRFRKKKQSQVGALKAGWADAARDLGGGVKNATRNIPMYVAKGHKKRGSGSVRGKGGKATLKITNRSNYIIGNTSAAKLWHLRTKKIEAVVERIIDRGMRKTKRKYKL